MNSSIWGVGLLVGIVIGLTSMGGGSLMTPALVLIGVPPALAIGSNVLVASCIKLVGGSAYALRDKVDWKTVFQLALGSIPGAAVGVAVLNQLPESSLNAFVMQSMGWVLILAGLSDVPRGSKPELSPLTSPPALCWTVLLGFIIGLLVSVTSSGSGSLLLMFLAFFYPLSTHALVGTCLTHAFFLTTTAAAGHALSGRVDWQLTLTLVGGGLPGVLLGTRLAFFLPERWLRFGLFIIRIGLGCNLIAF